MIRVYETCLNIRNLSRQQLSLSDDMALIAINAEIAAAKSTSNQEAFMILANETGKIAHQMSAHVSKILELADQLARMALVGVVIARRLAKISLGLSRIRRVENGRPVALLERQIQEMLAGVMAEIGGNQQAVESERAALDKQRQRVTRIITYFRIEASRDSEHGGYFRNIAEDLNELIGMAQETSQALFEILKGTRPPTPGAAVAPAQKGGTP